MALFEVRGLTRRPLFEGKDLVVEPGEIVVIQGPSGSGKTLFLRAVADLDPADAGDVLLGGAFREGLAPEDWRRQVLYVHQAGIRLPGSVGENLARVAGRPLQVEGLVPDRDASLLSGGEAQVLALERALAVKPRVLLLDESTSAMDPERRDRWEARLRGWVAEGRAILWVAHEEALAERLGARVEAFP